MSKQLILALASVLVLATGCGVDKKIEAQAQLENPNPTNPTNPNPPTNQTTPPESKALKAGANSLPISSFESNVQTFYYDFSALTAAKLDYYIESEISGCPADPLATFAIVDYTTGTETVVRDLGRSATIENPSSPTARVKVVVSGLAGCQAYGLTFRMDQI